MLLQIIHSLSFHIHEFGCVLSSVRDAFSSIAAVRFEDGNIYHCVSGPRDMCSGAHIPRGNTYHCNTGPGDEARVASPLCKCCAKSL